MASPPVRTFCAEPRSFFRLLLNNFTPRPKTLSMARQSSVGTIRHRRMQSASRRFAGFFCGWFLDMLETAAICRRALDTNLAARNADHKGRITRNCMRACLLAYCSLSCGFFRTLVRGPSASYAQPRTGSRLGAAPSSHRPLRREAANARCAAAAMKPLQRATCAAAAEERTAAWTLAARARARSRRKVTALVPHRPQTSRPNTGKRQRRARCGLPSPTSAAPQLTHLPRARVRWDPYASARDGEASHPGPTPLQAEHVTALRALARVGIGVGAATDMGRPLDAARDEFQDCRGLAAPR